MSFVQTIRTSSVFMQTSFLHSWEHAEGVLYMVQQILLCVCTMTALDNPSPVSCAGIMELSIAMVESRRRQQKGAPEQDAEPASPETSIASGEAKPAIAGTPQV